MFQVLFVISLGVQADYSGYPAALKVLKSQYMNDRSAAMFAAEVNILAELVQDFGGFSAKPSGEVHNKGIIRLLGITKDPNLGIVTGRASGPNLQTALRNEVRT